VTLQQQIRANRLRTAVVLLGFAVLVAALALAISFAYEPGLAGFVGIGAIIYGIISWFFAGRMVAAASGAHQVTKDQYPEFFRTVENAAIGAGMEKTPDVYVIDDPAPNAFAAGRDPKHAYVAATTGLLEKLSRRELEGVMAHEIAHIRNRDVRLMSLAAVLVGVIALISDLLMRMTLFGGGRNRDSNNILTLIVGIAAMILAPIGAMLLQMSLSRRREYLADATAAEITGDAEGLATITHRFERSPGRLRICTSSRHCAITRASAQASAGSSTHTRPSRSASAAWPRPAASRRRSGAGPDHQPANGASFASSKRPCSTSSRARSKTARNSATSASPITSGGVSSITFPASPE
jgi:heat shock protein HtpX